MVWTAEQDEAAIAFWHKGLSATQIAQAMRCGITRNAVIGRLSRLGLKRTAASAPVRLTKPKPPPKRAAPPPPRPMAPALPPKPVVLAEPDLASTVSNVVHLGAHMCKWPVGDPADAAFGFCGRASSGSGPYCETHHAIGQGRVAIPLDKLERSLRKYFR
jgi:GcrA cell cycle regulator